jgi:hypothetical protein
MKNLWATKGVLCKSTSTTESALAAGRVAAESVPAGTVPRAEGSSAGMDMASKRWSTGTVNSEEDEEFEVVLGAEAGDSCLEVETISLAQYKASEAEFEAWPPPNQLVRVAGPPVALLREEGEREHELFLRWRVMLAREPPLLDKDTDCLRGSLDVVMHRGCPNVFRKSVWLALVNASAAASPTYLGIISALRAKLAARDDDTREGALASGSGDGCAGIPLTEDGETAVRCLLGALSSVWSGGRWEGAETSWATSQGGDGDAGCGVEAGNDGKRGSEGEEGVEGGGVLARCPQLAALARLAVLYMKVEEAALFLHAALVRSLPASLHPGSGGGAGSAQRKQKARAAKGKPCTTAAAAQLVAPLLSDTW